MDIDTHTHTHTHIHTHIHTYTYIIGQRKHESFATWTLNHMQRTSRIWARDKGARAWRLKTAAKTTSRALTRCRHLLKARPSLGCSQWPTTLRVYV